MVVYKPRDTYFRLQCLLVFLSKVQKNMVYYAKIQIYYWYEFIYFRKIIQLMKL